MCNMNPRNTAFFAYIQNNFIVCKEMFGKEKALEIMAKSLEIGLKGAYDNSGFTRGNPQDFTRVLKERDNAVGLHVEFPEISENKIVYRFHDDPFPNLKEHATAEEIDGTYMKFKVIYLLGDGWTYKTTKHLWNVDEYTEYVIERKN